MEYSVLNVFYKSPTPKLVGEGERVSEPEVVDDSKETGPPDTTD